MALKAQSGFKVDSKCVQRFMNKHKPTAGRNTLWIHFEYTLNTLWMHFESTLNTLWSHFEPILNPHWIQFLYTLISCLASTNTRVCTNLSATHPHSHLILIFGGTWSFDQIACLIGSNYHKPKVLINWVKIASIVIIIIQINISIKPTVISVQRVLFQGLGLVLGYNELAFYKSQESCQLWRWQFQVQYFTKLEWYWLLWVNVDFQETHPIEDNATQNDWQSGGTIANTSVFKVYSKCRWWIYLSTFNCEHIFEIGISNCNEWIFLVSGCHEMEGVWMRVYVSWVLLLMIPA